MSRRNCILCAFKHLSQSTILISEFCKSPSEFFDHFDFIVGHLGEAEDHTIKLYPELSRAIREERTKMMDSYFENMSKLPRDPGPEELYKTVCNIYWPDLETLREGAKLFAIDAKKPKTRKKQKK